MKIMKRVKVIFGIVASVFGMAWAVVTYIYPPFHDDTNQNIYGTWLSKYSYPVSIGTVDVRGTTEYFSNGRYNFQGQWGYSVFLDNKPIRALYNLHGTGQWQSDSSNLITRLDDLKSDLVSLRYNNQDVDVNEMKELSFISGKKIPGLEDSIPQGLSEQWKIIKITNNSVLLEVDDPEGRMLKITMIKQDKRFQF